MCYYIIVPRDSEKVTESVTSRICGRSATSLSGPPASQPTLWKLLTEEHFWIELATLSIQIEYREDARKEL